MVKLKRISSAIDRTERNKINENYDEIEAEFSRLNRDVTQFPTMSEEIKVTATEAKNTATDALSVANSIDAKAIEAISAASTATNTANNAKTIAEGIDGKATNALQTAADANKNSTDAVGIAVEAETLAETVRNQFHEVIAEAGSNNPEVVASRTDTESGEQFVSLPDRLDKQHRQLTTQLAQTTEKLNRNGQKTSAQATVQFDDGYIWDYTIVHPYFASKGIKASFALISGYIASSATFMGMAEINTLKAYGHEFLAHTHSHKNLTTLTYEEQYNELVGSKERLIERGLDIEGIVYPENAYNKDTLAIVREHFEYGFAKDMTYNKRFVNYVPVDQYALYRITLEDTLVNNKPKIDKAIAKNGYIVLMGHSNRYNPDSTTVDPVAQWQNAKDNIEYLIAQGVPIVTAKEAMEVFGNTAQVGDDLLSEGKFAISNTGVAGGKGIMSVVIADDGSVNSSMRGDEFAENTLTIAPILQVDNAGFPTVGGTAHVYNFGERLDFVTQMWMPWNNNDLYIRKWLYNTKTWTTWKKISDGLMSITSRDVNIKGSTPITAFEENKLSINTYLTADNGVALGFPSNAGTLITYRTLSTMDGVAFQEWTVYGTNRKYKRGWSTATLSWTAWEIEGHVAMSSSDTTVSGNTPITSFELNAVSINSYLAADNGITLGFPSNAGTLTTYRTKNIALAFQEWVEHGTNRSYRRNWSTSTTNWTEWKPVGWIKANVTIQMPVLVANTSTEYTFDYAGVKPSSSLVVNLRTNDLGKDILLANARCIESGKITLTFRNFADTAKNAQALPVTIAYLDN